jgi:signal transduction histidine kinase
MSDASGNGSRSDLKRQVEEHTRRLRLYARRLKVLRTVDRAILQAESPGAIATAALEGLHSFISTDRSSVTLLHSQAGEAEILAMHQEGISDLDSGLRFPLEQIPVPDPLYEEESVVVDDLETAATAVIQQRLYEEEGIRSYMCLPMNVDGELIGMVNVGSKTPAAYGVAEQRMAQEVATQLAIAVRQARLQEKVRERSEELERRVAERTQELESFTYSVSHDLRTPLRAVDGFARLLMERSSEHLDAEGRRLLNVIYENTQKMGRLIDDLLALSRLSRQEMRRRDIDMEALVREALDEVTPPGEDPPVEIHELPSATGDRGMLRRVWVNLLSNALKFTRDVKAPHVQVEATSEDGAVVYAVHDNGAGFDDRYTDKLFGVFQRLHDDQDFEGTGVGLAIVERVIRRHGGRVWAQSSLGDGASFFFRLD